jgi:extracellular elastinolytic metalloproteinase
MGEGWSDYIPCTIFKSEVVCAWLADDPSGIRYFPYNSSYPYKFDSLRKKVQANIGGRDVEIDYSEVHNIGEIWCATLLEINSNIGERIAMQLVIDALKLSASNPGFLDERDAILEALDDMLTNRKLKASDYNNIKKDIWKVFAKFGMGPNAQSNGAQVSGIIADFNPPNS